MKVLIMSSSSENIDNEYIELAKYTSSFLSENNYDLVFGCCSKSMMGECYKEFLNHGRKIYSLTTNKYKDDLKNIVNSEYKILDTTFELKKEMFESSDLILGLPGGIGTLSEITAFIEENRSNDKDKPIIIYNYKGYYEKLIEILDVMIKNNFLSNSSINNLYIVSTKEEFETIVHKIIKERGE